MENRFPKNVRQIGNVSDTPKIYVEDYVDTFLNQLCDKKDETPAGAFLIGHTVRQEDQECVYISGAVRMEEMAEQGPDIAFSDSMWDKAREDCQKYFEDGEIIGWFVNLPGQPLQLNANLKRLHEQYFSRPGTILIMKDAAVQDELYFAYKYKELMPMNGHYIYYEKNAAMQSYMISVRKKIGVTPSEVVEDKAAKDFRNIVRDRFEVQEQKKSSRFMYVASVFLVLVVLIIGVTTINNYDKMQSVQSSLEFIRQTVSGENQEEEAIPTSGEVIAKGKESGDGNVDEKENVSGGGDEEQSESLADRKPADDSAEEGKGQESQNTAASTMQEMSEDIYVVEQGDTLAKISKKVYGDFSHVDAICRMNGLSDGNLIFIGQKLLLP